MDFLLNFSNVQIWRELYNVCFWSLGAQMSGWPPTCPDFSASEAALFLLIYLKSATFSNIQKGHVLLRMSVSLPPSLQNWECSCEWFSSLTLDIYQLQGTFSLHKDLNSTTFSNIQRIVATLDVCLASECPKKAAKTCMFSFLLLSTYKYQSLCSNISFLLKFLYVQRCSNSFNASLSAYESLKIHHARGMFSVFCSSLLGISWLRVAVFCSNIATPRPSQISKKK